MQRWSQVRSKEHSSMSGGKARGGGESWHGRGAAPGTETVPFLLHLLQQAEGCAGMLWDPALLSSKAPEPDCSGNSTPGCSRTLCSPSLSLQASPHPLQQHPPATSSCSPSAPQTGQTSCPWHGRAARAPGCCPCRAGRDQQDAMIRRMPGRDQECCAGRSCRTVPAMSARPRGHLAGARRPRLGGEPNLVGWSIISLASLS